MNESVVAVIRSGESLGDGAALDGAAAGSTRITSSSGGDLVQPELRSSAAGELVTKLDVVVAEVTVAHERFHTRTYEGKIPGPTLSVRPGDKLRIAFTNKLSGLPAGPAHDHDHQPNTPGHFNTTNLHTHGLNVSPEGPGDFVLRDIEPGESFAYEFEIPSDHPAGTYYYHAHRHGSTAIQVMGGLSGALIVRGDVDEVPEIAAAEDRVMLIQELVITPDSAGPTGWKLQDDYMALMFTMPGTRDQHLFAVNGAVRPVIRLRPGEVQRWRLIHAGFHEFLPIRLEGHTLHLLGVDGVTLPKLRPIDMRTPVSVSQTPEAPEAAMRMSPGNRWDVLVRGGSPGRYALKALAYRDLVQPTEEIVLADVIVEGPPMQMALPRSLPVPADPRPVADPEIQRRRSLTISVLPPLDPPPPAPAGEPEMPAMPTFVINGQLMDHHRMDYTIPLGAVEEWLIANHDVTEHPFHMHVGSFMVTEINGKPVREQHFQDVVIVPKARIEARAFPGVAVLEHVPGTVRLRRRFDRFPGRYVIHCHVLTHEDYGMMTLAEVKSDGGHGDHHH